MNRNQKSEVRSQQWGRAAGILALLIAILWPLSSSAVNILVTVQDAFGNPDVNDTCVVQCNTLPSPQPSGVAAVFRASFTTDPILGTFTISNAVTGWWTITPGNDNTVPFSFYNNVAGSGTIPVQYLPPFATNIAQWQAWSATLGGYYSRNLYAGSGASFSTNADGSITLIVTGGGGAGAITNNNASQVTLSNQIQILTPGVPPIIASDGLGTFIVGTGENVSAPSFTATLAGGGTVGFVGNALSANVATNDPNGRPLTNFITGVVSANMFYVTPNGKDASAIMGDQAHPFGSLTNALTMANTNPPAVIVLGAGTWPLALVNGTAISNNVSIIGQGRQRTTITYPTNGGAGFIVNGDNIGLAEFTLFSPQRNGTYNYPIIPVSGTNVSLFHVSPWGDSDCIYGSVSSNVQWRIESCDFHSGFDTVNLLATGKGTNSIYDFINCDFTVNGDTNNNFSFAGQPFRGVSVDNLTVSIRNCRFWVTNSMTNANSAAYCVQLQGDPFTSVVLSGNTFSYFSPNGEYNSQGMYWNGLGAGTPSAIVHGNYNQADFLAIFYDGIIAFDTGNLQAGPGGINDGENLTGLQAPQLVGIVPNASMPPYSNTNGSSTVDTNNAGFVLMSGGTNAFNAMTNGTVTTVSPFGITNVLTATNGGTIVASFFKGGSNVLFMPTNGAGLTYNGTVVGTGGTNLQALAVGSLNATNLLLGGVWQITTNSAGTLCVTNPSQPNQGFSITTNGILTCNSNVVVNGQSTGNGQGLGISLNPGGTAYINGGGNGFLGTLTTAQIGSTGAINITPAGANALEINGSTGFFATNNTPGVNTNSVAITPNGITAAGTNGGGTISATVLTCSTNNTGAAGVYVGNAEAVAAGGKTGIYPSVENYYDFTAYVAGTEIFAGQSQGLTIIKCNGITMANNQAINGSGYISLNSGTFSGVVSAAAVSLPQNLTLIQFYTNIPAATGATTNWTIQTCTNGFPYLCATNVTSGGYLFQKLSTTTTTP